ncbi:hypothetical protein A2U01_0088622 [Trifolium medium]|uniref:Uncharacterized protein n=1 Tax=Trifolium medium TaxID=97028 RepID=A0A392U1P8_9FABA|nr:hypothetical protein [Trifolium medium]
MGGDGTAYIQFAAALAGFAENQSGAVRGSESRVGNANGLQG